MTSTPTGCHGPKQSTWPRTDHSGGCWRPVALHTRIDWCEMMMMMMQTQGVRLVLFKTAAGSYW